MSETVIVAGARTPIGKFNGGLTDFSGAQLGGFAIKAALERAGLPADEVDYVIMGQVLQAGAGQITARQAANAAGIPMSIPALTVNKVCLSGLNAIALADQLIRAGEVERVVAGGMESMTNAPYLAPKMRFGARMGDANLIDSMMYDGLFCAIDRVSMGEGTENYSQRYELIARGAGRVRRTLARARREGDRDRQVRRRDRRGRGPAAQGRPGRRQQGRGRPRRNDDRLTRQAASRVLTRKGRSPPATRRRSRTAASRPS